MRPTLLVLLFLCAVGCAPIRPPATLDVVTLSARDEKQSYYLHLRVGDWQAVCSRPAVENLPDCGSDDTIVGNIEIKPYYRPHRTESYVESAFTHFLFDEAEIAAHFSVTVSSGQKIFGATGFFPDGGSEARRAVFCYMQDPRREVPYVFCGAATGSANLPEDWIEQILKDTHFDTPASALAKAGGIPPPACFFPSIRYSDALRLGRFFV